MLLSKMGRLRLPKGAHVKLVSSTPEKGKRKKMSGNKAKLSGIVRLTAAICFGLQVTILRNFTFELPWKP